MHLMQNVGPPPAEFGMCRAGGGAGGGASSTPPFMPPMAGSGGGGPSRAPRPRKGRTTSFPAGGGGGGGGGGSSPYASNPAAYQRPHPEDRTPAEQRKDGIKGGAATKGKGRKAKGKGKGKAGAGSTTKALQCGNCGSSSVSLKCAQCEGVPYCSENCREEVRSGRIEGGGGKKRAWC